MKKSLGLAIIACAAFLGSQADATVKPFLPPEPIEGEERAYLELIQAMPLFDNPKRFLRLLESARERTAGPTLLRAYIDCVRSGPLTGADRNDEALAAAEECISNFPNHPLPHLSRGMARVHHFKKPSLLTSGTDDLITAFSKYPGLYQIVDFDNLSSPLRRLSAAGELKRKTALIKAYFNPIYVPAPSPKSSSDIQIGIGALLEAGETAYASRLAGLLRDESQVIGLLSFKPAAQIWPALKSRHSLGYEAIQNTWAAMEKNNPEFNLERKALLSAMKRWTQLDMEARAAIRNWSKQDADAEVVDTVQKAAGSLWGAGLQEQSIALSQHLMSEAAENTGDHVTNAAFTLGYRMIISNRSEEGKALIKRYIDTMEKSSGSIEGLSGNAFLNAMRVCAYDGEKAQQALSKLEQAKGDIFIQKLVAYECLRDQNAMAQLISDRLNNGGMVDRISAAVSLSDYINDFPNNTSETQKAALELEPLKSTVAKLIRSYPRTQ